MQAIIICKNADAENPALRFHSPEGTMEPTELKLFL